MKILLTGTAGFIGHHLTHRLCKSEYEVVGLDNINDYYDVSLKHDRLKTQGIVNPTFQKIVQSSVYSNLRFIKVDLENENTISSLFKKEKFNLVIHLAAQAGVRYSLQNPSSYISRNIVGFFNILENVRQNEIPHLIYASSSSVYGNSSIVPFRETAQVDNPISLYAATKKSNELMAFSYSHLFKFKTTGLRFFTVYGPWGRPDMSAFLFANAILKNEPLKIFNQGKAKRDFTYVDDIVEAIYKIVTQKGNGKDYNIYNIGYGSPVNLLDYIKLLEEKMGKSTTHQLLPSQAGDVEVTYADTSKLQHDYNYKPRVGIDEGLDKFVEWFQSYCNLNYNS